MSKGGQKMARKGENIYKRKDGRWEARFIKSYQSGKAVYGYVYGKSYSEAKKKRRETMITLQKTEKAARTSTQPDFRQVSTMWLDSLRSTRKDSTIVKYSNQLNKHILPAFGDKQLSDINNESMIDFANQLLTGDKGLSAKSTADIISSMKSIRKYALLHGYEVGFVPESITISQKQNYIRVLSFEEEMSLLRFLREHNDLTSLGILICLFTGIRIGELCALTWDNISLEQKELNVRKTMQRLQNLNEDAPTRTYISIDEPKSKCSVRTIPIPDNIMEDLKRSYVSDAYVLTGNSHNYVEPRTMENRFKAILKKCGIEDANFHALRHSFATRCVEVGFDVKSLSEILGHANVNITLNRYVHPTMELKRVNMDKLSKLFTI